MQLMRPRGLDALRRFNAFFDRMQTCLVKRDDIITQLKYAVACKEHLLLEGKPGTAKSYLAHLFLDNLTNAHTFKVQCTKKMSEDYIVGPLDMKCFREDGIMRHRTEDTIVDCDFAFVDEIFDLSTGALRGMLEILNERTFTRGTQHEKSYLRTCVAATNFSKDDEEELEAVLDRFMFRAEVKGLTNDADKVRMLNMDGSMLKLDIADIDAVQKSTRAITVPPDVIKNYVSIISSLSNVTDRSLRKGLRVLQANAALEGRSRCIMSDITACQYSFSIVGNAKSAADFSVVMQAYSKLAATYDGDLKANLLFNQLTRLNSSITAKLDDPKVTFDSVVDQAREIVTIRHLGMSLPSSSSLKSRIVTHCDTILMKVEALTPEE